MQRATLGKSGSVVTRTASESDFQQQFGEYYGDDGCHSIYFDSSPIVRLSVLPYKVSNDATWACWCIILRKRSGTDKMGYRIFRRKYLLECVGKLGEVVGNRVTTRLSLYLLYLFCSFLFLSTRVLFFLAGYA